MEELLLLIQSHAKKPWSDHEIDNIRFGLRIIQEAYHLEKMEFPDSAEIEWWSLSGSGRVAIFLTIWSKLVHLHSLTLELEEGDYGHLSLAVCYQGEEKQDIDDSLAVKLAPHGPRLEYGVIDGGTECPRTSPLRPLMRDIANDPAFMRDGLYGDGLIMTIRYLIRYFNSLPT